MRLPVSPRQLLLGLLTCILILVSAHVCLLAMRGWAGGSVYFHLRDLFDVDQEGNLPAVYSTLQLLFAAALLVLLFAQSGTAGKKYCWHWLILGVVFLGLSADELFSLHERINDPVTARFGNERVPLFAWVIPYFLILGALALSFLPFWWRLAEPVRGLMLVAAMLYVGGGIGLEFFSSRLVEAQGWGAPLLALSTLAEEAMEMAGVAAFIYALALVLQGSPARAT